MAVDPERNKDKVLAQLEINSHTESAIQHLATALTLAWENSLPASEHLYDALKVLLDLYENDPNRSRSLATEVLGVLPPEMIKAHVDDLPQALLPYTKVYELFDPRVDFFPVVSSKGVLTAALSNPEFTQRAFELSPAGVESHQEVIEKHANSLPRIAGVISGITHRLDSDHPRLSIEFADIELIQDVLHDEPRNFIDQDTRTFIFELLIGLGQRVNAISQTTKEYEMNSYYDRALAILGIRNPMVSEQDPQAAFTWDSFKYLHPERPASQRFIRAARSLDHAIQVVPEIVEVIQRRLGQQKLYPDTRLYQKLILSRLDIDYWFLVHMGLASLTMIDEDPTSQRPPPEVVA